MSSINIGHLYKKRTVRNLAGQIIDLYDEADGGYIIQKGRVVNQEKYDDMIRKEEDKRKAMAEAINNQRVTNDAPDRTVNPSKVDQLEKRINEQDKKLDQILAALTKSK